MLISHHTCELPAFFHFQNVNYKEDLHGLKKKFLNISLLEHFLQCLSTENLSHCWCLYLKQKKYFLWIVFMDSDFISYCYSLKYVNYCL